MNDEVITDNAFVSNNPELELIFSRQSSSQPPRQANPDEFFSVLIRS